nr:MAG TPA: Major head protein [Caudoviricetes sp.]
MSQEETQATEGAKLEDTAATAEVEQPQAEEPKEQAEPTEPTTDWKANSRKWEDRAKSNKEQLDAALKEIEELKASQATNANEQLEQANAKIAELKLKIKVSTETGVPVELLQGSDEDAITASANALTSYAQSFAKSNAAYPLDKGGAAHSTAGNVEDIADPVARVQARARTLL